MNEGANKSVPRFAKSSIVFTAWSNPAARILNVDLLAIFIAILLPWSTSGVLIFVALWIFRVDLDTRYVRLLALVEAADLPFAGRTVRLGLYWNAMVKCVMGH